MAAAFCDVGLLDLVPLELASELRCSFTVTGQHHDAGCVRVESMDELQFILVNAIQQRGERVAIESSAWMHGQRRWLLNDDPAGLFAQDANLAINLRFGRVRKQVLELLTATHSQVRSDDDSFQQDVTATKPFFPL